MEYGILSLIPPILAIVIAIVTKQTILSLFIGVWFGATIISGWNPFVGFTSSITEIVIPSIADPWNASLLLLVTLAGGFVNILRVTGGARSFAEVMSKRINTRKKTQNFVWGSSFLFSYTEPVLILGTVTRPLADKMKVSRVKLAYILDSMGSPLAAMSPISSYGPFITGLIATQLAALGFSDNPWSLFIQMIPYNLYGLFAMIGVLFVINLKLDFGPMYIAEKRAIETGQLFGENDKLMVDETAENEIIVSETKSDILSFIIPMVVLMTTIFMMIFWTGNISGNGIRGAFLNANIVLSIITGFIFGALSGILYARIRYKTSLLTLFDELTNGILKLMIVPLILVMAWSIGNVADTMGLGTYITNLVSGNMPTFIVPVIIFVIGALIAFATGSSWGVFAIMMPIAIPLAAALDLNLALAIGAVISGGLFGDHCSPISDTTIMASTGAAADHVEHVRTQLPYAIVIAFSSAGGFLASGLTQNAIVGIIITAILLLLSLFVLRSRLNQNTEIEGMS
nr:Na+/H+ antiporter NhaC family protein [Lysinibacillus timonensis]